MFARIKAHKWIVAGALFVFVALGAATQTGIITLGDDASLCAGCVTTGNIQTSYTPIPATATRTPTPTPTPSGPTIHASTPDPSIIWTLMDPESSSYASLFIRASDTDIWRRIHKNGAWQAWEHIPYGFSSAPAGAWGWSAGDYVFARGNNNAVYYRKWYYDYPTYAYKWTEWQGLGGNKTTGPAAVYSDGVYTFARGTDNQYYYRFLDDPWADTDSWGNWVGIGGSWTSAPAVTVGEGGFGPSGVYVFGRGTDNAIYYRYGGESNGWLNPWKSLGGQLTSAPSAVRDSSGSYYVFAKGTDNALWYRHCSSGCWNEGSWGAWQSAGGQITSAPAVSRWGTTASTRGIIVVARGTDNALWSNVRTGTGWQGWTKIQ